MSNLLQSDSSCPQQKMENEVAHFEIYNLHSLGKISSCWIDQIEVNL